MTPRARGLLKLLALLALLALAWLLLRDVPAREILTGLRGTWWGPPAFITLWDRTRGSADVRGVAAMSSLPMYLNTTNPALRRGDPAPTSGHR